MGTSSCFPITPAIQLTQAIRGNDERSKMMRRTIIRYLMIMEAIVFRDVSTLVRRRFPTMQHLVTSGLMSERELKEYDDVITPQAKYWLPIHWALSLITLAKDEGRITGEHIYVALCDVVHMAVYSYFVVALFGRQFLIRDEVKKSVAEILLNPLGEDDDDFECNWMIDRNLQSHVFEFLGNAFRRRLPSYDIRLPEHFNKVSSATSLDRDGMPAFTSFSSGSLTPPIIGGQPLSNTDNSDVSTPQEKITLPVPNIYRKRHSAPDALHLANRSAESSSNTDMLPVGLSVEECYDNYPPIERDSFWTVPNPEPLYTAKSAARPINHKFGSCANMVPTEDAAFMLRLRRPTMLSSTSSNDGQHESDDIVPVISYTSRIQSHVFEFLGNVFRRRLPSYDIRLPEHFNKVSSATSLDRDGMPAFTSFSSGSLTPPIIGGQPLSNTDNSDISTPQEKITLPVPNIYRKRHSAPDALHIANRSAESSSNTDMLPVIEEEKDKSRRHSDESTSNFLFYEIKKKLY
ncbi:Bestrophin [Dictyocaulus viviparus]|uniref:Bestrophin homolog n=1 Tax=Dictyocaulus viviparus TaxID=29172 RepID=A0A0D8XR72_DICVI|nr:Bestrophin [Dictyocaulus viviparus]